MKTKEALGEKRSDFLKLTSTNFLEHEKWHNVYERIADGENNILNHIQKNTSTHQAIKQNIRPIEQGAKHSLEKLTVSESKTEDGIYAPKRYVTNCYFQPRQYPVLYSETMIINIGSSKKKYFDCVYCENRVVPYRWTENMTTFIPGTKEPYIFKSDKTIPVHEDFHYMSLEDQQPDILETSNEQINYV